MRLLEYNNDGEFSLTTIFGDDIPRYAILSHTWGVEEVTFRDLMDGTARKRLAITRSSSAENRLGVTACNTFGGHLLHRQSNSTELAEAINYVRWYRDAAKCYVYLSDVSRPPFDTDDESNQLPWEVTFGKQMVHSRLDPSRAYCSRSVESFSKAGATRQQSIPRRHICE